MYLFFDVSGTLLARRGLYWTIVSVLQAHGITRDELTVRQAHKRLSAKPFPSNPGTEFYRVFNAGLCRELGVPADETFLDDLTGEIWKLSRTPFPDTGILAKLPQPVGIISNWGGNLDETLTGHFPDIRFVPVVYSAKERISKPDPRLFTRALKRAGIPAAQGIYIGDSISLDVEPAEKVGMRAILIDRDNDYPDFRGEKIRSLIELERVTADDRK